MPNPFPGGYETLVEFLDTKEQAGDLKDAKYEEATNRRGRVFAEHFSDVQADCVAAFGMEEIWRDAQTLGIPWSPIRKPEENVEDEQWQMRETFNAVEHPELGETFSYIGAPMLAHEVEWRTGPRAPLIGEHNDEVYGGQLGLSEDEITQMTERKII